MVKVDVVSAFNAGVVVDEKEISDKNAFVTSLVAFKVWSECWSLLLLIRLTKDCEIKASESLQDKNRIHKTKMHSSVSCHMYWLVS